MVQTALEEALEDSQAAKGLLQAERDSTALLSKAREAAVQVSPPPVPIHHATASSLPISFRHSM